MKHNQTLIKQKLDELIDKLGADEVLGLLELERGFYDFIAEAVEELHEAEFKEAYLREARDDEACERYRERLLEGVA